MRQAFAGNGQSMPGLGELPAQYPNRETCAAGSKAAKMGVSVGFQGAGQGSGSTIEPLPGDREQLTGGRKRARGGAQPVAPALLCALPAEHRPPRQALDLDEQLAAD